MQKLYDEKRFLIKKVFETGQEILGTDAKNSIAEYFEILLKDDYDYEVSAKTLVRCYDNIYLGKNPDYKLKNEIAWDFLSKILNYKNFKDFCENENFSTALFEENKHGNHSLLEEILKTLVSIKDNLSFVLSHFMMKQSSFGILGILLLAGFLINKSGYFQKNDNLEDRKQSFVSEILSNGEDSNNAIKPQTVSYVPQSGNFKNPEKIIITERKKECMFWKNDHYEPVFCDEENVGESIIALNEDKLLMKKINLPDTLNEENALGKVWYNKNNHKVEFFTHYGIHPTNGKTLKPVTKYILDTYVK